MEGLKIDQEAIEKAIVEQAVDQLAAKIYRERDIHQRIENRAEEIIAERVDAVIAPIIENGVEGLVMNCTNEFGETKGEPRTFTEYAANVATTYLHEIVTPHSGEPVGNDTWSKREGIPRLAFFVRKATEQRIQEVVASAAKTVQVEIGKVLGETVRIAIDRKLDVLNRV